VFSGVMVIWAFKTYECWWICT